MLKNLFQIPDTFEPDDHRRRQVVNIMLMIFALMGIIMMIVVLTTSGCLFCGDPEMETYRYLFYASVINMIGSSTLLVMNRSPHIPGWINATIFVAYVFVLISRVDTPYELYYGGSQIAWIVPILLAAVLLHPASVFVVTAIVCVFYQLFTPPVPDSTYYVNYYSLIIFFMIAFISWLGMSIANRAIRDARREAANMQAIYQHVADGVLVLDLAGNFLSANPALLKMIPEEDLLEIIAKPLGTSSRWSDGKTLLWKRKVFSVMASPVPEVGTVAVFRDETRRHETERARDALLAVASHELRTPLAATMNYLELLRMLVKLDRVNTEEFSEHLTRAIENSKRLQALVNDILDQAQIQAGVLELKPQSFSLRALLDKVRNLLDSLIQQKGLAYELTVAPEVPEEIVGDPERLHQVLVNLIGNAIKFTKQGGIKVSVSKGQQENLFIEVADTGSGIPPEQLPDIFEAFRRGSNYAQRERQGAGLGLSIAKEIVTRMGGQIAAASQFGAGSTFTVTLPIEGASS